MRIDQITIHNFRCFETLALDLHSTFNVLIGENGAGKTAVLEALAVAAGSWLLGISGAETRNIWPNDVRLVGKRIGDETTFEPQYPVVVLADGVVDDTPMYWSRSLDRPGGRTTQAFANHIKEQAFQADRRVRAFENVTLPIVAYYGAGRLWLPSRDSESRRMLTQRELSRLEGYRGTIDSRVSPRDLRRWLEYQARVAFQEGRSSPVYRAVLDAMKRMVEDAVDVRFDAKTLEIAVEFKNGEVHPFAQLSDGQRNMLALAGDIAMRMARLNPQFNSDVLKETRGVVLIDEIDLHLHPRWQRHVVADLRRTFPMVQFITTTHSPQIISEIQPESVTVLTKESDLIVAYKAHQAYGLDTNGVLQRLMADPARPELTRKEIDAADDALEEGDLDRARERVGELRRLLHGDDPEVARLEASIYNLEALASDAVD